VISVISFVKVGKMLSWSCEALGKPLTEIEGEIFADAEFRKMLWNSDAGCASLRQRYSASNASLITGYLIRLML
jgi:hypothetical protein